MLTRRRWMAAALATVLSPSRAWSRHSGTAAPFPLFDAHLQLLSEDLSRYPRAPIASPPAAVSPLPSGETPEVVRVLRWMDQSGVAAGAAVQHRASYGLDNRYLLDSTDQYRSRLRPVAVLDAEDPSTPAQIPALIAQHGLAGVRLTGSPGRDGSLPWLGSPAAERTWAAANAAGLVMDLMTLPPGFSAAALADCARLARRYPNTRVVLDHCAWPIAEGPPAYGIGVEHRALAELHNVYLKFTTVNLESLRLARVSARDALRHYVEVFGAERIMWGSDIGSSAGLYTDMIGRILAATAGLRKRQRHQLLHDSGAAVFR